MKKKVVTSVLVSSFFIVFLADKAQYVNDSKVITLATLRIFFKVELFNSKFENPSSFIIKINIGNGINSSFSIGLSLYKLYALRSLSASSARKDASSKNNM